MGSKVVNVGTRLLGDNKNIYIKLKISGTEKVSKSVGSRLCTTSGIALTERSRLADYIPNGRVHLRGYEGVYVPHNTYVVDQ